MCVIQMDLRLIEKEQNLEASIYVTKYQRNLLRQVETFTDALGLQEHYSYGSDKIWIHRRREPHSNTEGREVKYSYNPLHHPK